MARRENKRRLDRSWTTRMCSCELDKGECPPGPSRLKRPVQAPAMGRAQSRYWLDTSARCSYTGTHKGDVGRRRPFSFGWLAGKSQSSADPELCPSPCACPVWLHPDSALSEGSTAVPRRQPSDHYPLGAGERPHWCQCAHGKACGVLFDVRGRAACG